VKSATLADLEIDAGALYLPCLIQRTCGKACGMADMRRNKLHYINALRWGERGNEHLRVNGFRVPSAIAGTE
jgi:hypothetical protein